MLKKTKKTRSNKTLKIREEIRNEKMPNPSNSFLVEGEGETLFAVEMLFLVITKLLSLAMMILSLLVGFVYLDCQREMSICLLVSGFLTLCVFLEMTGGMTRLFRSSLIGISIFSIVWNIYAAVLFMPVAAGRVFV